MSIILEVLSTVKNINSDIFDSHLNINTDILLTELEYLSNGYGCVVKYAGTVIFSSEDDYRECSEEYGCREDLEVFLRNQCKDVISNMNKTTGIL